MKKLLVLAMVAVLGVSSANAQLTLGLKGGLNFATLSSLPSGSSNDGSRIGLVFGAYSRIKVPVIGIFVQPELVFAQKGGKLSGGTTVIVNTLDIPILVGKTFGPVRIGLGPVFGFPVTSEIENSGVTVDASDNTSSPLAGLQLGLGLNLPAGLGLDLRYEIGLTKIYDNTGVFANNDTKTNAIQFTVSYKLL
ncbi:hypothetical protein BKI52_41815 [marine bacterium AO1-C]|nr:hypothetical protein BKI52_41815 [marine bacterium AO1-C]